MTQTTLSVYPPSQPLVANVFQSSNPKGNQISDGKKKECEKKKYKGGKGNTNKPSEETGESEKESKNKVKFPCKLCDGDHLTHIFPKIQDAQRLLAQQGSSSSQVVLANIFPQGKQLLVDVNVNTGTPIGATRIWNLHHMCIWLSLMLIFQLELKVIESQNLLRLKLLLILKKTFI